MGNLSFFKSLRESSKSPIGSGTIGSAIVAVAGVFISYAWTKIRNLPLWPIAFYWFVLLFGIFLAAWGIKLSLFKSSKRDEPSSPLPFPPITDSQIQDSITITLGDTLSDAYLVSDQIPRIVGNMLLRNTLGSDVTVDSIRKAEVRIDAMTMLYNNFTLFIEENVGPHSDRSHYFQVDLGEAQANVIRRSTVEPLTLQVNGTLVLRACGKIVSKRIGLPIHTRVHRQ